MRTKSTPVRFAGAVRDWPEDADEDKENAPRFSIQVAGEGLPAARYRVSENVRCRKVVDAYSKRVGSSAPISLEFAPGVVFRSDGTDGLAEDVCLGEIGVCAGKAGGNFVVHAAKLPSPIPDEEDETTDEEDEDEDDDSSEEHDAGNEDEDTVPPSEPAAPTTPPEPVAPDEEDEDEDDSSEEMDAAKEDAAKAAPPPETTAPPEPVAKVQPRKTMVTRAMMRASASASASASACQ